ncbi:MuDR family transposase [Fagus crenata]
MTSNFGELFYSWASDAHELPITQMVDVIRGKIMELIYTRQTDSIQWLTRLAPSMEEKLKKETHMIISVNPIPSVDMHVPKDSSQLTVTVTPPPTRRPPGRPTTKRYGSQEVVKRQLQCSRCKGQGHNKSTCKEFI